jgi:transposase
MDKASLETIEGTRAGLTDLRQYRKLSMVLAVEQLDVPPKKAAKFFGYSLSSFHRIRQELFDSTKTLIKKASWGGRRGSYFSLEQEAEIAENLRQLSLSGGFVDISKIREILEKEAGATLHKTTIYRFLERHGFRKVAPRKYHPKRDLEAQESFKKTSKT